MGSARLGERDKSSLGIKETGKASRHLGNQTMTSVDGSKGAVDEKRQGEVFAYI